jgi:putative tryptophan/tyrosine transport system substrate-binding protein
MPVVGFLDARSLDAVRERLRAFRQGLKDNGYTEGENVTITYRFAENQVDRLPALAADLVRRQVAMIATAGDDVAVAAKAATTAIPIVFILSQDPVKLGLVTSVARPGANATGINFFAGELGEVPIHNPDRPRGRCSDDRVRSGKRSSTHMDGNSTLT